MSFFRSTSSAAVAAFAANVTVRSTVRSKFACSVTIPSGSTSLYHFSLSSTVTVSSSVSGAVRVSVSPASPLSSVTEASSAAIDTAGRAVVSTTRMVPIVPSGTVASSARANVNVQTSPTS